MQYHYRLYKDELSADMDGEFLVLHYIAYKNVDLLCAVGHSTHYRISKMGRAIIKFYNCANPLCKS